jgi:thiamine biosynthesis protein ThiS
MAAEIEILVNDEPRRVFAATTLAQLIEHMGVNAATVVAEVSGAIVAPEQFAATTLRAGDRIELVRFVGGG